MAPFSHARTVRLRSFSEDVQSHPSRAGQAVNSMILCKAPALCSYPSIIGVTKSCSWHLSYGPFLWGKPSYPRKQARGRSGLSTSATLRLHQNGPALNQLLRSQPVRLLRRGLDNGPRSVAFFFFSLRTWESPMSCQQHCRVAEGLPNNRPDQR